MQTIEQHPYVNQVLAVLEQGAGAEFGDHLEDDPVLDFLEQELMKMGSLAHTAIDWPKVEREALGILTGRSKDLKVLGFLLLCLLRGGSGERFALALWLLAGVLGSWWAQAWPHPGVKGERARQMLFKQMFQRAAQHAGALSFDPSQGDGQGFCQATLSRILTLLPAQQLPAEPVKSLQQTLARLPTGFALSQIASPADKSAGKSAEPASAEAAKPATASLVVVPGSLTLDPDNERATRQSLLKVAELLTATDAANPLGYQLRRHALWFSISGAPPTRDGVRTELAAISADRVADYQEALAKAADSGVWQRIEQSVAASPFWLDGHWLSARAAHALGHSRCAEAIRGALAAFVERLPALQHLAFSDGTEFLCAEAKFWLQAPLAGSIPTLAAANPWDQAYQQACERLADSGLAAALQLLEDGLLNAREPRERFYWRLASNHLLQHSGLITLAQQQQQDLRQQLQGRTLETWEPGLLKQLEEPA
ncbi:MAG TPA: type VI secretion system protein TssA [Marinobacter sp.]|nr:type VI secretion system protein TssA [Marinobacter sp.]